MLFASIVSLSAKAQVSQTKIDLRSPKSFEILTLENISATPDSEGDLLKYELQLPEFKQLAYYGCDDRFPGVAPCNKTQMWVLDSNFKMLNAPDPSVDRTDVKGAYAGKATADGTYTIVQLTNGKYMIILPLVGEQTFGRILYTEGKNPTFITFTWGAQAVVDQTVPLFAYAMCDNLYEANYMVWNETLNSGLSSVGGALRSTKHYPEMFNYLGWCSWEEYRSNISEAVISKAVDNINNSGIPVRWILLDDGTQYAVKNKLKSFEPDAKKFPNGFDPILKRRSEDGIKWMGIWQHQAGYFGAIDPQNDMSEEFNSKVIKKLKNGSYRSNEDYESHKKFLEALVEPSIKVGFDFAKIDFQSVQFAAYKGEENAVASRLNNVRAQEEVFNECSLELLNCMSQDLISAQNTKHSVVTRSSQDYRFGVATGARIQTYQSFNTSLWLGQTSYPDPDMFHSSDDMCNLMMSYSKSVACAPVYLSDAPEHFAEEYIMPMCYEDGEILKPLAPAVPLAESMFSNPINTKNLYKVIAPLEGGAAAMICYNLYDLADVAIWGAFSPADYKSASAMLQPYPGEWKLPSEGLILYDLAKGTAQKFTKDYSVTLEGISAYMVNLCPINKGWAVVGETSKHLSPVTVEGAKYSSKSLSFRCKMSGEFKFWRASGTPYCNGAKCTDLGGGLYSVKASKGDVVTITLQ